ncbi:hypothetical protein BV20DRAFT_968676 [Pilatotrama ljubarskyi]|nr:hypothetical protein BV20DRAFT_968676 [Pilatotrama ljubarskyi]
MPPSHPLPDILVSGRPSRSNYRVLTPRTPHSRAGRAEEGFTEVELQVLQDDEANEYRSQSQQQSQPLLSPNSRTPGYRSRGDDHDVRTKDGLLYPKGLLSKLPLLGGSVLALFLLVLVGVAITRPGALEAALLQPPGEFYESAEPYVPENDYTVRPYTPAAQPTPSIAEARPLPEHLISYENYSSFPLTGDQYRYECAKLMGGFMHHGEYWDEPHMGSPDVVHHDDVTDDYIPEDESTRVCSSTITYLLDGHVGLMADLALMAQAAAFAKERNRTFFVDDTHWNRGKWSDHFQDVGTLDPGPEPGCLAPPPEELVACPRTARHWVISSRTAKYHMGHPFSEEYEDPYGHQMHRLRPIFERARESFEQVIRPSTHMAALIRTTRKELVDLLSLPSYPVDEPSVEVTDENGLPVRTTQQDLTARQQLYVAVHIRKGDRVPDGYVFYKDKQIPLEKYVEGAKETWDRLYVPANTSSGSISGDVQGRPDVSSGRADHYPASPIMWLASDSPAAAREFVASFPPATAVFSLEHSTNPELRALAPVHEYVQAEFEQESLEERIRLTKGMIVDFAMLSGFWASPGDVVPAAVVCGVGSNVCKTAALGFGFDRAFGFDGDGDHSMGNVDPERRRWVDVDVDGRITPAWQAFEFH